MLDSLRFDVSQGVLGGSGVSWEGGEVEGPFREIAVFVVIGRSVTRFPLEIFSSHQTVSFIFVYVRQLLTVKQTVADGEHCYKSYFC